MDVVYWASVNEDFSLLISIRESLRPKPIDTTKTTPKRPVPSSVKFLFWLEVRIVSFLLLNSQLSFVSQNFTSPVKIEVPREGQVLCMNDFKLYLGRHEIERTDKYMVWNHKEEQWKPLEWDGFLYLGFERFIYFRREDVTCLPEFSSYRFGLSENM